MLHTAKKGFTLIELLIVVVIIGILAAIAIPKFSSTKDKAKLASVKTDVRNYMTAEEAYFSDKNTYGNYSQLTTDPYSFTLSQGNAADAGAGVADGYKIGITNASISDGLYGCSVETGSQVSGTHQEGVIFCETTK